jgi:hypothetical protein
MISAEGQQHAILRAGAKRGHYFHFLARIHTAPVDANNPIILFRYPSIMRPVKPLNGLRFRGVRAHRAEATVLMRSLATVSASTGTKDAFGVEAAGYVSDQEDESAG